MNQILFALLSFSVTFVIGALLVPESGDAVNVATVDTITPHQSATVYPVGTDEAEIEFFDLPDLGDFAHLEPSDNLIDIFETGGIYRKSEVVARTGEQWLTLGLRNGSYSLISSTATVTNKRTVSYVGDEHDVELSFGNKAKSIFAVRDLPSVKAGPVDTVYHRPSREEITDRNLPIRPMEAGYKREFNLNDNWYTLRVSRGRTQDGTTVGVLVLEHEGIVQIVAHNYDQIIGELLWVGDLDRDGKLDLYFDEFNEKGYFGVGLYLSSSAERGKLVKLIATFSYGGC